MAKKNGKTATVIYGHKVVGRSYFKPGLVSLRVNCFFWIKIRKKTFFLSNFESRDTEDIKASKVRIGDRDENLIPALTNFLVKQNVKKVILPASFPYGIAKVLEKSFEVTALSSFASTDEL